MPAAFSLSDEEFDAVRAKLATVPREQWPSDEVWDQAYLSCLLKAMENAEHLEAEDQ